MGTGARWRSYSWIAGVLRPVQALPQSWFEKSVERNKSEPLKRPGCLLFLNSFSYRWLLFDGPGAGPGTARMAHVSEAGERHWRRCWQTNSCAAAWDPSWLGVLVANA